MITAGIDVGCSLIKFAVMRGGATLLGKRAEKIRKRDPRAVAADGYAALLEECGLAADEIRYLASTGEGELVDFRTGHFYGMTTHARGGLYLDAAAGAALDIGALHARAMTIDGRGRVLQYRMTSQCASGSGQFLENISRYLGISIDEIGPLSLESRRPEACSSICAVLAETDVINMVSRGVAREDILKGIHLSIGGRLIKLLRSCRAQGVVVLTGGLSQDVGLVAAMNELTALEASSSDNPACTFVSHPDGIYAGALGAAIWAEYRLRKVGESLVA